MSRRDERRAQAAAEAAQQAASEAGRVLQQRQQEARAASEAGGTAEAGGAVENVPVEQGSDQEQRPKQSDPPPRRIRTGNPEREAMLAEIEAREKRVAEEIAQGKLPGIEGAEEAPPETPTAVAPQQEAQVAAPVGETPAPPAVETVRVKVDGEEFDAPKEEVEAYGGIRAYQTAKASENRLKKTNEALAETKSTTAQLMQLINQIAPKQPAVPQVSDAQFIAQKMEAIRYGTPEEGAAAMSEIMNRGRQKQADPDDIAARAVIKVKWDSAVNQFKQEFADVFTNPILLRAAVALDNERLSPVRANMQAMSQFDFTEHYRRIGNEIRSVVGKPSQPAPAVPSTTTGTPSQPSDKEARKASIVNLPTAAARATPPAEAKPETREDILREVKKSRGIPV